MFLLNVFYPPLSILIHSVLIALYCVSAAYQGGKDMSDPEFPQPGPPWYITKDCNVAKDPGNIGYCQQAKSGFACTIVLMLVPILLLRNASPRTSTNPLSNNQSNLRRATRPRSDVLSPNRRNPRETRRTPRTAPNPRGIKITQVPRVSYVRTPISHDTAHERVQPTQRHDERTAPIPVKSEYQPELDA